VAVADAAPRLPPRAIERRANAARVEQLGCCLFNSLLGGDFL